MREKPLKHKSPLSMVLIQFMGSLTFAVILISALALVLIVSTSLESLYGTPFAQKFFYQTGWFDVFLGLLGTNILFSAVLRFPYKKRHTGFVMTHIGILLLLSGSLMTRYLGIDGQMMIYEGQKKDSIVQTTYELMVHQSPGTVTSLELTTSGREIKRRLDTADGTLDLTIHKTLDNVSTKTDITDSPATPVNHAAQLSLSSERTGVKETIWLVENNPLDPEASRFSMGPATFEIADKSKEMPKTQNSAEAPKSAKLHLYQKDSNLDTTLDLENIPSGDIPVGQSGFKVLNLKYYPDARVGVENKLVNASDKPQNPAVEFDLVNPEGESRHYVKFTLFPEFESLHGKNAKKAPELSVDFLAPTATTAAQSSGPSLTLFYTSDGSWSYRSKSSKSVAEGSLEAGQTYQTGWMDFSFRVDSLFDHASIKRRVRKAPGPGKGQIGAQVSISQDGKTLFDDWVLEDEPQTLDTGASKIILALQAKNRKVPFSLELKDFRKMDYPGTSQPSSFESDVTLFDPEENLTLSKTIRMNQPLDYKGYRIFQSSYIQDAEQGEASVFTVAKNPGIYLIYGGAIVIFLGIFLVFFVPPFSSMLKEDKK